MLILDKNIQQSCSFPKKWGAVEGDVAERLRNIALTQHNEEQVSETGVDCD